MFFFVRSEVQILWKSKIDVYKQWQLLKELKTETMEQKLKRLTQLWCDDAVADAVKVDKKLSYCRETARCVASVEISPIATQQCRNYLYDKF